jgi:hypothetical protein
VVFPNKGKLNNERNDYAYCYGDFSVKTVEWCGQQENKNIVSLWVVGSYKASTLCAMSELGRWYLERRMLEP